MTKDKKSGQLQGRLRCRNVCHCFYCYYHLTTGELAYSNGGQHLALSFMADGSIRKLVHNHGTALGIIQGLTYKQDTEKHEPGQILILYIDGVTESSSEIGK